MAPYRLGLYEKSMPNSLSIAEKLSAAQKAGFDFMEISIDESDEKLARLMWSRQDRQNILNDMQHTGIKLETMCLSGHRKFPIGSEDSQVREQGMKIMRKAIQLASDLGVRVIQIAGYDEYYKPSNENTARLFLENLRESVDYASQMAVILAFETMETDFMNTVAKALAFVNKVGSPYLQIYPDLGNLTNAALLYGNSVTDDLAAGRGHIAALHLKETLPGVFREVPYGKGHVNFAEGIATAFSLGVRVFVGEFWHVDGVDWQEQLIYSNNFLRKAFAGVV